MKLHDEIERILDILQVLKEFNDNKELNKMIEIYMLEFKQKQLLYNNIGN